MELTFASFQKRDDWAATFETSPLSRTRLRRASNDYCLSVFSKYFSHGVGDFAYGGIGFNRGKNSRHKIFSGAGGFLDLFEGGSPAIGIPAGAQRMKSFNLPTFQGFIDVLDQDGRFVLHGKAVYADHHSFPTR